MHLACCSSLLLRTLLLLVAVVVPEDLPSIEPHSRISQRLSHHPQPTERNSDWQHSLTRCTRPPAFVLGRARADRQFALDAFDASADEVGHLLHGCAEGEEFGGEVGGETEGGLVVLG